MMQEKDTNDMASTAEELTKQVSLASSLLAEHQWRDGGEVRMTINHDRHLYCNYERHVLLLGRFCYASCYEALI